MLVLLAKDNKYRIVFWLLHYMLNIAKKFARKKVLRHKLRDVS